METDGQAAARVRHSLIQENGATVARFHRDLDPGSGYGLSSGKILHHHAHRSIAVGREVRPANNDSLLLIHA